MRTFTKQLGIFFILLFIFNSCSSQSETGIVKSELLYTILESQEFNNYKAASKQTTAFIRSGELDFELLRNQLLANPDQMAAPSKEFLRAIPGALEYSELSSREVMWLDSLDRKFGYLTLLNEDDLDILLSTYSELQNKDLTASEKKSLIIQQLEQKQ